MRSDPLAPLALQFSDRTELTSSRTSFSKFRFPPWASRRRSDPLSSDARLFTGDLLGICNTSHCRYIIIIIITIGMCYIQYKYNINIHTSCNVFINEGHNFSAATKKPRFSYLISAGSLVNLLHCWLDNNPLTKTPV